MKKEKTTRLEAVNSAIQGFRKYIGFVRTIALSIAKAGCLRNKPIKFLFLFNEANLNNIQKFSCINYLCRLNIRY